MDFNLPTGYKLSNDRDQVTEITIPFGSTGGHTMVVEKGDLSSIVKIQFVDAENNDEVVAGGDYFVDGDGDGIFHTREIAEWVPEGYELQEVGDFQVELYKETTRLHVYGSPSVTSSYLIHLWIFALHSAHTTKVFLYI